MNIRKVKRAYVHKDISTSSQTYQGKGTYAESRLIDLLDQDAEWVKTTLADEFYQEFFLYRLEILSAVRNDNPRQNVFNVAHEKLIETITNVAKYILVDLDANHFIIPDGDTHRVQLEHSLIEEMRNVWNMQGHIKVTFLKKIS